MVTPQNTVEMRYHVVIVRRNILPISVKLLILNVETVAKITHHLTKIAHILSEKEILFKLKLTTELLSHKQEIFTDKADQIFLKYHTVTRQDKTMIRTIDQNKLTLNKKIHYKLNKPILDKITKLRILI